MAGFRDFQTGEVLTAANVNDFLMQQTVMKFADAAARDTALGTAVGGSNALREGMVAYLDSTDEVIRYDGTAWGSVGGGLVAVKYAELTATQTLTTISNGTYSDITNLSITHETADPANKLIIIGTVGVGGTNDGSLNNGALALAVYDGSSNLGVGDATANRVSVGSGGVFTGNLSQGSASRMVSIVHTPGAGSKTYKLRVAPAGSLGATYTIYINRTVSDTTGDPRGISTLMLMEVKV